MSSGCQLAQVSKLDGAKRYVVAVRVLCAFAAKAGDLDHRFTPSPTAQDGIEGHQIVAGRRGQARRNEVNVAGDYKQLTVRGRADGLIEAEGVLEEVKTYRGDLQRMPANHRALHWAQAKVYGALLCRQLDLAELKVSLVYFEIASQEETILVEVVKAAELEAFFAALCESFLAWAERELEHRRLRDAALTELAFPHEGFRAGQRPLAENVYQAARLGRDLAVQAPTGIGKTMATLFPMLKACAKEGLDKVFYLTAKVSGQELALSAIASMRQSRPGLPLRVLELVARNKSCEHPDKACNGESCPLASGFYDKLPAAREAAVEGDALDRVSLRDVARAHTVCPYYLTQELVRWSDVVVADYNYFFDSTALLHGLTLANQWKVGVLVDEAHNLLERARGMYSCELQQMRFEDARRRAPSSLQPPMRKLQRAWSKLSKAQTDPYSLHQRIPEAFEAAVRDLTATMTAHITEFPAEIDGPLLDFYFDALAFNRLAETFGQHSMVDSSAAAHATVVFSATLSPQRFYADMLGLAADTAFLEVESPFTAEQLDVRIVANISTRWSHREASLAPIVDLIADQYRRAPGNYLAFFSSFDYMERVAAVLRTRFPDVPCWFQLRGSDEIARAAFLRRFHVDGCGVGFAVLGGAFSEGIDLPGRRLIGAFIATLGLPQMNAVNEEMRRQLQKTFGSGYDYAYLYPGIRKVVQAAGRIIRTTSDRGSLVLIDNRFADPKVWSLLPTWWSPHIRTDDKRCRSRPDSLFRDMTAMTRERLEMDGVDAVITVPSLFHHRAHRTQDDTTTADSHPTRLEQNFSTTSQ